MTGPTSIRPSAPLGLIGALALIAAVEVAIARDGVDTMGGIQCEYRLAREMADRGVKDCRVLTFGDSMMKLGVSPAVIRERSGVEAYNFGITGAQAPVAYFLLRRALASGCRPKALVVEYFPSILGGGPQANVENWPFLLDPAECFDLARASKDDRFLNMLLVRELLPSARCAQSIRWKVMNALAGKGEAERELIRVALRSWEANRGMGIVKDHSVVDEDLDRWQAGYFNNRRALPCHLGYIDRFLKLAAEHEIRVFWLLPPYKPALQARCERIGFDAYHESFIKGIMARHQNLSVIDARHSDYDPRVFMDAHHLATAGAVVYSAELGDVLRRHVADPSAVPRWVALPKYRDRPSAAPIEYNDVSRKVVIRSLDSRRR